MEKGTYLKFWLRGEGLIRAGAWLNGEGDLFKILAQRGGAY